MCTKALLATTRTRRYFAFLEPLGDRVGDRVGVALRVTVAVCVADRVADRVPVALRVSEGVAVGVTVADGVTHDAPPARHRNVKSMLPPVNTPPTTAKRTRVPAGGVKLTRDPKLSTPQPGASSSADAGVQPNVAAALPGQPVPTHSFVSNVLLHTSTLTVVPLVLRG